MLSSRTPGPNCREVRHRSGGLVRGSVGSIWASHYGRTMDEKRPPQRPSKREQVYCVTKSLSHLSRLHLLRLRCVRVRIQHVSKRQIVHGSLGRRNIRDLDLRRPTRVLLYRLGNENADKRLPNEAGVLELEHYGLIGRESTPQSTPRCRVLSPRGATMNSPKKRWSYSTGEWGRAPRHSVRWLWRSRRKNCRAVMPPLEAGSVFAPLSTECTTLAWLAASCAAGYGNPPCSKHRGPVGKAK